MKEIRVFAPATVANMGCGFDIMGMTLDAVGDVLKVEAAEGDGVEDGIRIENRSAAALPEDPERNVITPALRAFMAVYGAPLSVKVTVEHKITPGSGIGSSAASSAAAVYGLNELLGRPFRDEELVAFAMEGEKLISGVRPTPTMSGRRCWAAWCCYAGMSLWMWFGCRCRSVSAVRLPTPQSWSARARRARCCRGRYRCAVP